MVRNYLIDASARAIVDYIVKHMLLARDAAKISGSLLTPDSPVMQVIVRDCVVPWV